MTDDTNTVRPIDRARARTAMIAALTGDTAMLFTAVSDAADDERDLSIHLLVAAIADDAVSVMLTAARNADDPGRFVLDGLRQMLAGTIADADAEEQS